MNDIESIKCWTNEPIPIHNITPDDFEVNWGIRNNIKVEKGNVIYTFTPEIARPVYEEDLDEFGPHKPEHHEVYEGGMDWVIIGDRITLTGDVDGIPCEATWLLSNVEISTNWDKING